MATTTSLLGLVKPAASEAADIAVLNSNFDIIDTYLANAGVGKSKQIAFADLDSARAPGWYHIAETELVTIGGWEALNWYIRVDAYVTGSDNCVQHLYPVSAHGLHLVRYRFNGAWQEAEWVNPWLKPGVEYRTTERYNKLPVYVKMIDFGALPNTSSKTVNTGVPADSIVEEHVRIISSTGNYLPSPYFLADGSLRIKHMYSGSTVQITTASDHSGSTAQVVIRYTKD